jgi:hypothetical protein
MNFPPQHVDNGYLKVLIVAEALVAEMSSNFFAILDCFCLCFELDPNYISMLDAILLSKKNFCIVITYAHQSGVSALVPSERRAPSSNQIGTIAG